MIAAGSCRYLELPLEFDADYETALGNVRVELTEPRQIAEASQSVAICPMCKQPQDAPSCERREHWGVR